MDIDKLFGDLFEVVAPIIDNIACLRWGVCCKHMAIPLFIDRNMGLLRLFMPLVSLQKILDAGDNWLVTCSTEVLAMQRCRMIGDAMFSAKIKGIVENELGIQLSKKIQELADQSITKGEKV